MLSKELIGHVADLSQRQHGGGERIICDGAIDGCGSPAREPSMASSSMPRERLVNNAHSAGSAPTCMRWKPALSTTTDISTHAPAVIASVASAQVIAYRRFESSKKISEVLAVIFMALAAQKSLLKSIWWLGT